MDGPFFGQDVPKLDVDPFDALLKPLLERDSKQCNAWKDEVQNILVFVRPPGEAHVQYYIRLELTS